jgi:hypothetical protein
VKEGTSHHIPGSQPGLQNIMTIMTALKSNEWITTTNKRGSLSQDDITREPKHIKSSEYWLTPTITTNRFTVLQQDELDKTTIAGKETTPKPPPIYITNVTTISPLIQLLDQAVPQLL